MSKEFIYANQSIPYTNLHQHSSFSNLGMLDAFGLPEQIVDRCLETGAGGAAITDHGSVSGHIRLIKDCKKKGIKPLCGCEMYVVDDLENLKSVRDKIKVSEKEEKSSDENIEYSEDEKSKARQKMHFNVFAKNQKGLLNLWGLVSTSRMDGYYFKPSIDWSHLAAKKENLFFGTACEIGPLGRLLDHYKYLINKEKRKLLTELIEPREKKEQEIEVLKKEIKQIRKESAALKKLKHLTKEKNQELTQRIKNLKHQIFKINNDFEKLEEEVEEKRKSELKPILDKYLNDGKDALKERLLEFKNYFGDNLYVEIIPEKNKRARWKYLLSYQAAKEAGVMTLCTNDSHAPKKEDTVLQDLMYTYNIARSEKEIKFTDESRPRYTPGLFYIHGKEEMFLRMKDCFPEIPEEEIIQMMRNTQIIVDGIEEVHVPAVPAVQFQKIEDSLNKRPTNLYKEMQKILQEGWKFRKLHELPAEKQKEYLARVTRELEVILYKGYIDYFMIMQDIMDWCDKGRPLIENFDKWYEVNGHNEKYKNKSKEERFEIFNEKKYFDPRDPIGTGIARGSAGGSLVAYLMRITNIDPMPGELMFERFIDYTRGDVYYIQNYEIYNKPQFLKEYPEENKERLEKLESFYRPQVEEKVKQLLSTENCWYDKLQIAREFWLLNHNQGFTREKEYFYTLLDKKMKGEIEADNQNQANSILSWLMGITLEEPKGDYLVNLTDIPDIDSDFEDARRNEVYEYLQHRYGIDNSCRIATYTVIKGPSAIDLLSKIFDCDLRDIVALKDLIPDFLKEKKEMELKEKHLEEFLYGPGIEYVEKYPWLKYVKPLYGQIIALGMHAAGMIIHNQNISQFGAIYRNKDKKTGEIMSVVCWDSVEAEGMGLMKLDLLSLNTVTNVKRINKLVEDRHGFKHHWQRIPGLFEDEKTKDLLERSDLQGLFQLEGAIMTHLSKIIKPRTFEEVVLTIAGGRPGPLEDAMDYGKIKSGELAPYYYNNEIYKSITEKCGGKIIYQEDVMKISKLMCKYDDKMVGSIRKWVSKKKQDALDALEPDFVARLQKHAGMSAEESQKLWDKIKAFGAYAFNKCLSGESKIKLGNGEEISIKNLHESYSNTGEFEKNIISYNQLTGEFEEDEIVEVMYSGEKEVFEIELEDGKKIKSSKDHKFLTNSGWKKLEDLTIDDKLTVNEKGI